MRHGVRREDRAGPQHRREGLCFKTFPKAERFEDYRVMLERRNEFPLPPKTIPRLPGHRAEWVQACRARKPEDAKAGFAFSGPFTQALLVGNLATRLQQRIEWDAVAVRAKNAPDAEALVRKKYRAGFGIS